MVDAAACRCHLRDPCCDEKGKAYEACHDAHDKGEWLLPLPSTSREDEYAPKMRSTTTGSSLHKDTVCTSPTLRRTHEMSSTTRAVYKTIDATYAHFSTHQEESYHNAIYQLSMSASKRCCYGRTNSLFSSQVSIHTTSTLNLQLS